MVKWIAAEKARTGLRHAVVCPNVTGRTKERITQSKRARVGSLAIVDEPEVVRTCIPRAFFVCLPMSYCLFWRYTLFLSFVLFRFRLLACFESAALQPIVLRYARAPAATHSYLLLLLIHTFSVLSLQLKKLR